MKYTFKKGIHPKYNKFITEDMSITPFDVPDTVYIPLSQHGGAPATLKVAVGDNVKRGQLIAEASGFVSANIFSSVSGEVKAIGRKSLATGAMVDVVEITNDSQYDTVRLDPLVNPTKDSIIQRIKDAGIVGMGGAAFPTHVKLNPKSPVDVLIINAAECEPYITCDYRMMVENSDGIVRGIKYLMTVLGVERAIIGIEKNKAPAIEIMRQACKGTSIEVIPLEVKYPQGAEKQLIYAATGRKVPAGGLPMDSGAVVDNVQTAYAIHRACDIGEPLWQRVVTVSGKGVAKPGNYLMATGTTYSYIADVCGASDDVVMVVSGGPMMGFSVSTLDVPVVKGTSSILFMTHDEINESTLSPCINCSKCAQSCPMNLMPVFIDRYALCGDFDLAKKYGAMNCLECGCCAFTCPAKRPLVQSIRYAKKKIREGLVK